MNTKVRKRGLIHPRLSYKIVGLLFEVFKELGPGYQEKHYQKAIKAILDQNKISYKQQVPLDINFHRQKIGKYFLDFLIDDKIVLEVKRGEVFLKTNIEQVYGYLKATGLKLGIIANFTKKGVRFKRIVNLK